MKHHVGPTENIRARFRTSTEHILNVVLPLVARDERHRQRRGLVLLTVLLIIPSVLFVAATNHGIGILPDSIAYMRIGSAEHFAPLYTWLLQATSMFGMEITAAAWWLGWVLLVTNTVLVFRICQLSSFSLTQATFGTALIVSHPVFTEMHSVAMAEPLYIALTLASILTFLKAIDLDSLSVMALAGAVLGAAMLARFAAAPVLPALAAACLLQKNRSLLDRLTGSAVLTLVSFSVFATWAFISEFTTGQSTGRAFELLGRPDSRFWITTINAVAVMLLPSALPFLLRLAVLGFALGVTTWLIFSFARGRRRLTDPEQTASSSMMPVIFGLISIFYAALLIVSVFVQYRLNLTGRFLLPLYVFLALTAVTAYGATLFVSAGQKRIAFATAVFAVCLLASHAARSSIWAARAFQSGQGYASQEWAASPVLKAASQLPSGRAIYSNAPDLIAFLEHRNAEYLPRRFNHLTGKEDDNRPFAIMLAEMLTSLQEDDAYLVFVDGVDWRDYLLTETELLQLTPLETVAVLPDGRVYRWPETSSAGR